MEAKMADGDLVEWMAYDQALAAYRAGMCGKKYLPPSFGNDRKTGHREAFIDNVVVLAARRGKAKRSVLNALQQAELECDTETASQLRSALSKLQGAPNEVAR
jgi:hypothetical protein